VALCKDPVTKELNDRGYNLVKLPRAGIEPMDVLGRDAQSIEKLGSIAEVWTSKADLPKVSAPLPAAGIAGAKSSDLDLGIGLKLLSNVLAGLGGGFTLPSLNAAFKKAKKVQFTFANVESTSITPFALGKFLAAGTLDTSNPFVTQYFGNDETQEYIIFDVLKSDALSVTAKTDTGVEVDADVGALSGGLNATVKANVGAAGSSEITFQGPVKATFAFKLFEVNFENGKWVPRGAGADEDLSFALGDSKASAFGKSVVVAPGRMLRINPQSSIRLRNGPGPGVSAAE
jgi:hypothetical protein